MDQSRRLFAAGAGFCLLLALIGAARPKADCGNCILYTPAWCDQYMGENECHLWDQSGEESPDPRCEDEHLYYQGDLRLGYGTGVAEHPGTCGNPGCSSEEDEDWDSNLMVAVETLNFKALETLVKTNPYAWVEVNEDRLALQILSRCAMDPVGNVVAHFPVDGETIPSWNSAISGSSLATPPAIF